jgi:hypothetical protein
MPQIGNSKSFGRVKVKRVRADLDSIADDCGYEKKFRYNIDMNSNGIMGDCIEWCQHNCEGRWGWWFDNKEQYNLNWHNWEDQEAYMSFEKKKDALRFWLAVGVQNMGRKD